LIDDLWALAVANLPELPNYEASVNARAKLTGRNLEPWRAVLAVAFWLEDKGVQGLAERIEHIAIGYQSERQGIETNDLTVLVIRAVCKCLVPECDVLTFCDVLSFFSVTEKTFLKTSEIAEAAKEIAEQEEMGIDVEGLSKRIGWKLKGLRVEKGREPGTGKRGWLVSKAEMKRLVLAYGLVTPEKTSQNDKTSQADVDSGAPPDDAGGEREVFEL
jgi:hypothetical protein